MLSVDVVEKKIIERKIECWRRNLREGIPCFFVWVDIGGEIVISSDSKELLSFIQSKLENLSNKEEKYRFLQLLEKLLRVLYKSLVSSKFIKEELMLSYEIRQFLSEDDISLLRSIIANYYLF